MNIPELVKTALDASTPTEARQAAYRVLDATGINSLPIDTDSKLALLWAAILDDLEPTEKRQARFKAQERPTKAQPQDPPTQAQPPAPSSLPEWPLNGHGDYFRRDLFLG